MSKMLLTVYPRKNGTERGWNFFKIFEVDHIPRIGEGISMDDDCGCYETIDMVVSNPLTGLTEVSCDCELFVIASWLNGTSTWTIRHEDAFRKDESEIRRHILEAYEEDDFVPMFERREDS